MNSIEIPTNRATEISIGSKCYDVAITAVREWQSSDGAIARKYLTIGAPGIREIGNAYLAITTPKLRNCDVSVETPAGTVVWTPIAGGITGAKKTAINNWLIAALS